MIACWGASTIGVAENSILNKRGKTFDSYRVYDPLGHTGNKEDKILTRIVYGMVLCAGTKKGVEGDWLVFKELRVTRERLCLKGNI